LPFIDAIEKEATMSAAVKSPQAVAAQISLAATEIVRSIVDHPSQVTVEVLEVNHARATLLLKVHPDDMETLLAHEGRILRALRTFAYAVSARNNLALQLQLEATGSPPVSTLPPTLETSSPEGQTQRSDEADESQSGL
jgi:predicted RNA-binding protein YlqC (UPF0109 family)